MASKLCLHAAVPRDGMPPHPLGDGLSWDKAYISRANRQILHTTRPRCTIHHSWVRGSRVRPLKPSNGWR